MNQPINKPISHVIGLAGGLYAVFGVAVYAAHLVFPAPEPCSPETKEQHVKALKDLGAITGTVIATTQDTNGQKCSLILNIQ